MAEGRAETVVETFAREVRWYPELSFVPRDLLTRPMEVAATLNPVTYVMEAMRSFILESDDWTRIGRGVAVVAVAGALMVLLNVRAVRAYD